LSKCYGELEEIPWTLGKEKEKSLTRTWKRGWTKQSWEISRDSTTLSFWKQRDRMSISHELWWWFNGRRFIRLDKRDVALPWVWKTQGPSKNEVHLY